MKNVFQEKKKVKFPFYIYIQFKILISPDLIVGQPQSLDHLVAPLKNMLGKDG